MSSTGFDDNPFGAPGSGTAAPEDNPFSVSTVTSNFLLLISSMSSFKSMSHYHWLAQLHSQFNNCAEVNMQFQRQFRPIMNKKLQVPMVPNATLLCHLFSMSFSGPVGSASGRQYGSSSHSEPGWLQSLWQNEGIHKQCCGGLGSCHGHCSPSVHYNGPAASIRRRLPGNDLSV